MDKSKLVFYPMISSIQKIALYETKSKFYLLGSNNTQTRFRVLKIDRTEPKELIVSDDKIEYTKAEIHNLVGKIEESNRARSGQRSTSSLVSAFGIVGFIRFLEGYYIILVTKRRRVAVIGYHTIYKIEDTCMIYIPNETVRLIHPDEPRYVKMFQSIDLSSNFYFSYSYDLTHSLQVNMAPPRFISPNHVTINDEKESNLIENENLNTIEETPNFMKEWMFSQTNDDKVNDEVQDYGVRSKPHRKFVWNTYLLSPVESEFHPDWIIYVTHGFVGQSNMTIFGRSVYVTLIARRSNKYAGTRFLKRGANFEGDVANEVETEQMVHDSGVSSLSHGRFSSFVQMRGSVPGHWSQDISKMVPKPSISIDLSDPFAETAGAHFNELFKRYGSPVILLNLVKKREKKKHESFLSEEMSAAVKYLNQFLPPDHHIQYVSFDMARMNKGKEANVMGKLANIAYSAVLKTGIFQNQSAYFSQKQNTILGLPEQLGGNGRVQTGIIRTNCIDCLDRTNTAQFAIGKCVLGFQLCALGILDSPKLEFDTDCVRMLESLYEDHGDTLALQYGGSQLVHRIKTYRKTAPWTSQGNDIMQTLSRYYSNTFSDAEKQNTINLFLGLFVPDERSPPIWDYVTDYYLHHQQAVKYIMKKSRRPKTQWWDSEVLRCLPRAYNELTKSCSEMIRVHSRDVEMIDAYADYHRPFELSMLTDTYAYKISNSIRDFMPNFTIDFSPFTVRIRPGRRREETTKGGTMKNPSLTGQSSTSSAASSTSSSTDSESSDDDLNGNQNESQISGSKDSSSATVTFESLFPSMRQVYGTELENPKRADILMYKRYVLIGRKANGTISTKSNALSKSLKLTQQSTFSNDTSVQVKPPTVSKASNDIYEQYVLKGKNGGGDPKSSDLEKYVKYVNNKLLNEYDLYAM